MTKSAQYLQLKSSNDNNFVAYILEYQLYLNLVKEKENRLASKSVVVRAAFGMRRHARALRPGCRTAWSGTACPVASGFPRGWIMDESFFRSGIFF